MGKIYKNGISYGGGTGSAKDEIVELTYAEYQALSSEEKNNGTTYFINDIDSEVPEIPEYTGGTAIQINEENVVSLKDIKKNYIDNSNFRINQTGATEYSTADEYTVDRWYIDGGILTPVENGVQFVNTNTESGSTSLVRLKQNIGYSFEEFMGKSVTLSAKINGTLYSGTATIPTEKPTEGTAIQYVTVGVPAFGINLNYSITGDYFVPYIALAYNTTIMVEWMKLEINDEFSGYIEPDYATELIKIDLTTSTKGNLDLPYTKDEVNTAIKAVIDDTSEGSEGSTWSSNKIVEETLSQITHSDYEKLNLKTYTSDGISIYIGYGVPSFMAATGISFDLIITDKRGYIKYKAHISISSSNIVTARWENDKNPSEIGLALLGNSGGQMVNHGILVSAAYTTILFVQGHLPQQEVDGKVYLGLQDLLDLVSIISNYDVYVKQTA